jgi:glycosyltransferase involved in cell wall biosynthesis
MPKLSIITINFNDKSGLKKTMDSVIAQSSKDFEYIVIDGGSNDGSKELIESHANKLAYWISEPDKGIYHAMNKGILAAKGEYCQFLNSGDFLTDNNVITAMLEQTDDFSIVTGHMVKIFPNNQKVCDKINFSNSLLHFYKGTINHSSSLIKKTLFEKYGLYDESLKIVSDWKFFLNVIGLRNESVKYVDIDVTVFDMTGISSTNSKLERQERRKVLEELLPKSILVDYDLYWRDIEMMRRFKRHKLIYKFVWLMDRILFKIEKIKK